VMKLGLGLFLKLRLYLASGPVPRQHVWEESWLQMGREEAGPDAGHHLEPGDRS